MKEAVTGLPSRGTKLAGRLRRFLVSDSSDTKDENETNKTQKQKKKDIVNAFRTWPTPKSR